MSTAPQGSFRLFRLDGIDVFLHWSWFLVAAYEIQTRNRQYSSITWNVIEYLALFLIVLLHEFGHSLACRSVGGTADRIVLWPMGGVAFVNPPQRPGATLWSIVAGPLVNVALLPLLIGAFVLIRTLGWAESMPDAYALAKSILMIDVLLLVFNILPIYPLDGGQILRSILWFFLGRARSLMVATIVGFVGVAGFILLAIWSGSIWYGALSVFMLMNCWSGLRHAQALLKMGRLPRREGAACPSCRTAPPLGNYWKCGHCGQPFDMFETEAACPHCGTQYYASIQCLDCGESHPFRDWVIAPKLAKSVSATKP